MGFFYLHDKGGACRQIKLEPTFVVGCIKRVILGEMRETVVVQPETTVLRTVGVEYNLIFTLGYQDCRNRSRTPGGENCKQRADYPHISEYAVVVLIPYLHQWGGLKGGNRPDKGDHGLVEIAQIVIFQIGIICQMPLSACIFIGPVVPFTGKIDPFGMTELVTHEIEIAAIDGGGRHQTDHLMQGDATVYTERAAGPLRHVPVHIGIDQPEDDGLVAHQCLVVALGIGDGLFIGAPVGNLPPDGTRMATPRLSSP